MPESALRALGAGLAEALVAVHAAGIIHRDLKPANILLSAEGPRVIDFGVSKAADDGTQLTGTEDVLGTPAYLSPEQITAGYVLTPASDVFSLGGVLAFAATGTAAFGTGMSDAVMYRVVHTEPVLDAVPPSLRGMIARCLDKYPDRRPAAHALLQSLAGTDPRALQVPGLRAEAERRATEAAEAAAEAPVTEPPAGAMPTMFDTPTQPAARRPHRRRFLALAAGGAVAVAGAASGITWAAAGASPARKPKPTPTGQNGNRKPTWTATSSLVAKWSGGTPPTTTVTAFGDLVLWSSAGGVIAYDAATGARRWTAGPPSGFLGLDGTSILLSNQEQDVKVKQSTITTVEHGTWAKHTVALGGGVDALYGLFGVVGGTAIVQGGSGTALDTITAVDLRTGRVRWAATVPTDVLACVANAAGCFALTAGDGSKSRLYRLNPGNGRRTWSRSIAYAGTGLTYSGGILLLTIDGAAVAVNAGNGHQLWSTAGSSSLDSVATPIAGGSGSITYDDSTVFGLSRNGEVAWRTPCPLGLDSTVSGAASTQVAAVPLANGNAVTNFPDNAGVFAVNAATGARLWQHRAPANSKADWGIAVAGGNVYATDQTHLYAFLGAS
jgi:outer membrane protein assembly factor BamB